MSPQMQNKRLKVSKSYSRSVSPASLPLLPAPSGAWRPSICASASAAGCCSPPAHPPAADYASITDSFPQIWDHVFEAQIVTSEHDAPPLEDPDGLSASATTDSSGHARSATAHQIPHGPGSGNHHAMIHAASQDAPDLENPFVDNALEWISTLNQARRYDHAVEINGYIKCRFPQLAAPRQKPRVVPIFDSIHSTTVNLKRPLGLVSSHGHFSPSSKHNWLEPPDQAGEQREVPRLPPGFGFKQMSRPDRQLFMFYCTAWCVGRTILPTTNCWLTTIPSMAKEFPGVEHAMLALAGTYVLDYLPDDRVRRRSNNHYNSAVRMLTEALSILGDTTRRTVDSEALVASIALLNMMDVISPERRRPKDFTPRWLEGGEVACRILSMTDRGFRYYGPKGPQPSTNRIANTIISSRVVILALPMTPIRYIDTSDERFSFLSAQATERATRQIHGACGCSPRLLQRFAQITDIASMQEEDKYQSVYLSSMIKRMRIELRNLRQWSPVPDEARSLDPSAQKEHEGYPSTEALLEACKEKIEPGQHLVTDKISMTFLTAEAWRLAAIIYFELRVLRLPRSHKQVIANFEMLAACIRLMPTSGALFTAQAPFFPVFLLGLMAPIQPPGLRRCAYDWFESVTSTSCRSSVPPAFDALKRIQRWIDGQQIDGYGDDLPEIIGHRRPWWEDVVHYIKSEEGVLCLV